MKLSGQRVMAVPLLLVCLSCETGTSPVAPDGTTLTVSANPSRISPRGTSEIRVTAFDSARGTPVRTGTEIRLTTSIGTVDEVVLTDGDGVARATLRGDGRTGSASVSATSGLAKPASASTTVTIANLAVEAAFDTNVTGLTVDFSDRSSGEPTSWLWDFDDGGSSTDQHPQHTYAKAGTYRVTLEVSAPDSGNDTVSEFVTVETAVARFSFAANGLVVQFTDESTPAPDSWRWEFDDGSVSTLQNPSHTYAAAGAYRVRLTIGTPNSGADSTRKRVEVAEGPVADFVVAVGDLEARFSDRSTGDPDTFDWDFGDGATSRRGNPTHTYADAGTFSVTLTVANDAGDDSVTKSVTVSVRLEADFSFVVDGLDVDFTDESIGAPTSWSWDFGDGLGTSTVQNPAYSYAAAGTYEVKLTAKTSTSESIITKSVTVQ